MAMHKCLKFSTAVRGCARLLPLEHDVKGCAQGGFEVANLCELLQQCLESRSMVHVANMTKLMEHGTGGPHRRVSNPCKPLV